MRLKSLDYKENFNREGLNSWELEKLTLGQHNLIIGKNATGKSRIINVIHNLARMIKSPIVILDGEWSASFVDELNQVFHFSIVWKNGKILSEKILINNEPKLIRDSTVIKIFSETTCEWQEISPPNDRLVLHVRRDKTEFPFLENLFFWANGVRSFSFANTSPNLIEIPGNPFHLESLNTVPSALEKLSNSQLSKVLKQLKTVGYDLETASTGLYEGLPPTTKIIFFKERGITNPLKQFEISQGMFRAFSILVIIEFLRADGGVGSILVDDFGEGLDFERSKKLAEVVFGARTSNIQFIATSNDSFLTNVIPLNDLTICYRTQQTVKCLNYANSKEKFDAWQQLGLNNFDLFSSNYLLN